MCTSILTREGCIKPLKPIIIYQLVIGEVHKQTLIEKPLPEERKSPSFKKPRPCVEHGRKHNGNLTHKNITSLINSHSNEFHTMVFN